jgi:hypothetical protein
MTHTIKTFYLVNARREILRKLTALDLHAAVIMLRHATGLDCNDANVFTAWTLKTVRENVEQK